MKSLKIMLLLIAVLTFALPSWACGGDESADHSGCKMHQHRQHSKKNQKTSDDESNKQIEADRQQEKSKGDQDKDQVH